VPRYFGSGCPGLAAKDCRAVSLFDGFEPPATRAIPWWFFHFRPEEDMSRTKSFFRSALPWVFTLALILNAVPLWAGTAKNKTEIIADQATKTVRIVVDGKDIAVFDSHGLHVDGNVDLTGSWHPATISGPAPLGLDTASSPARKP
jgi:hypothetical protein